LTLKEASAIARDLGGQVASGAALTFDASALKSFDSSAFAVLLDVMRRSGASGAKATVVAAPASMVQLAKLYGVDSLIEFKSAT
jgi:phospholipid transport system transporter-binding protein